MRIKTGDLVEVIAGKKTNKGQQGKVLKVLKDKNRVVVEGVNMITKHLRPSQSNPDGGTQTIEGSIHISNVMLVDPKTKKPTRVGVEIKDGKKVRVTKKSGSVLD
ncbi:MAG: 50S ribosomal protein L24 [Bacilli bacterium]|jgi:large subunit ribosomal protein L24|nr:50S ribosomal protein L24 [Bacilli bacterium]